MDWRFFWWLEIVTYVWYENLIRLNIEVRQRYLLSKQELVTLVSNLKIKDLQKLNLRICQWRNDSYRIIWFYRISSVKNSLERGDHILGVDGLSDYYDITLKKDRNIELLKHDRYVFEKVMLEDKKKLKKIMAEFKPDFIIHLAAQAGVRYSIDNPEPILILIIEHF